MDPKEQVFLKRLRATFRVEAQEHLLALSAGLLAVERSPDASREAAIEVIFREAHSLKGAARSVNLVEVEALCRPLEAILAALKRQELTLEPALFTLLNRAVDSLAVLVLAAEGSVSGPDRARFKALIGEMEAVALGGAAPGVAGLAGPARDPAPAAERVPAPAAAPVPAPTAVAAPVPVPAPPPGPPAAAPETIRIPLAKLEPLLLQAEAMIQAKLSGAQRGAELHDLVRRFEGWKTALGKGNLPAGAGPGAQASGPLEALSGQLAGLCQAFAEDQRVLQRLVDQHLEAMKQVLMVPVATLLEVFPRLVRELARDQGKAVELVIAGADLELDKRIVEALKDPLIHLVRNCVDHGFESPELRAGQGKPARGTLTLTFTTLDSRQVEIRITDDGAGIPAERLRAAAVKAGLLTAEAARGLELPDLLPLVFQSGLSTRTLITDLSGRGLGLAIVREKVEALGGQVSVASEPGQGTTVCLRVPLNLAAFRGVRVAVGDQQFVLPAAHVERVLRVEATAIRTVENRATLALEGQILALVRLSDLLGLPPAPASGRFTVAPGTERLAICILASAEQRLALQVDAVLGEEEVLVKGLGRQLTRVRHIAGATLLGAGKVVLVLHVPDLMASAARRPGTGEAPPEAAAARPGRILVAEDSITARSLLKNILETGGYQVATAVDGADAFSQLRAGQFDLVVSDVDMPRLSGFELTARIRADPALGAIPVVLVTSLESRADRERGIEVGANAYLIKSSFDQSNLLGVIQQLL